MSLLIKIAALCVIISSTQCVTYEDYYDFSEIYSTEEKTADGKAPIYDLKDAPKLFEKFIKDFSKEYKDKQDYNKHYENFRSNLEYINTVNKEAGARGSTSDINLFADLGEEELNLLG